MNSNLPTVKTNLTMIKLLYSSFDIFFFKSKIFRETFLIEFVLDFLCKNYAMHFFIGYAQWVRAVARTVKSSEFEFGGPLSFV